MKTLKLTKAEISELIIALDRRTEDFINYTAEDLAKYPEIEETTNTLTGLVLKVLELNN